MSTGRRTQARQDSPKGLSKSPKSVECGPATWTAGTRRGAERPSEDLSRCQVERCVGNVVLYQKVTSHDRDHGHCAV